MYGYSRGSGMLSPGGASGYGHAPADRWGLPAAEHSYDAGGYGYDSGYGADPAMHMGPPGPRTFGSPGMRDPQRAWDFTSLANSLQDMEVAVVQAGENLASRDTNGFDIAGMEGTVDHYGNPLPRGARPPPMPMNLQYDEHGLPIPPPPQIVYEELPAIAEHGGPIHKKGGGKPSMLFGRSWTPYFMRLQPLDDFAYDWGLGFYEKDISDKPSYAFRLDGRTRVMDGDREKRHKNKNVKFDFSISNENNEQISLYTETYEEALEWMDIVRYVVVKIQDYEYFATHLDELQAMGGNGATASQRSLSLVGQQQPSSFNLGVQSSEQLAEKQALADEAQCHSAYGPGLYEGTHGEQTYFIIQAHDPTGVPKSVGGDMFTAALVSNELEVEVVPVDNGDGTYICEYTPSRAGDYELRVLFYDNHIYGSPFHLTVEKAPTAANHCVVYGDGVSVARPGAANTFTVKARDQFDNDRNIGGDTFEILVIGAGKANPIIDNGDGTYTISYTVDTEHKSYKEALAAARSAYIQLPSVEVHISLNNEGFTYARPVSGSPFRPKIVVPELEGLLGNVTSIPSQFVSPALMPGAGSSSTPRRLDTPTAAPVPRSAAPLMPDADVDRLKMELEFKDKALAQSLAEVEEMKRKLDEDRQLVDRQMTRMNELGRKVKEDSERLAEQARVLRAVTANSPRTPVLASPLPVSNRPLTSVSPDAGRIITSPGRIMPVDDGVVGPSSAPSSTTEASRAAGLSALLSPLSAPLNEAPADLFEPDVMILFDKYKKPLFELWQYYSTVGNEESAGRRDGGLDVRQFIELYCDFDIAPTFLTRKELKHIFAAAAKAHAGRPMADEDAVNVPLGYAGFVEALGRTALLALAKPAFQHLYPTARDKVLVLLDMWGMADPRKLQEMQRKPRYKSRRK